MRILHIVTLVTPTGAFGGPVRVAENQCRELQARGHEVVIAGAFDGFESPPTSVAGVPAHLFKARRAIPRTGFSGISSPALMTWLKRNVNEFDVVHIHLGRDLVTLPAARIVRRAAIPYVAQTHGMIIRSRNPLAAPLDAALTRRILRDAQIVFYLTPTEQSELIAVAGLSNLAFLPNGIPAAIEHPRSGTEHEVLFMARLHTRKNPDLFVESAAQLLNEGVEANFVVAGPDEGMLKSLKAEVDRARVRVIFEGPIDPVYVTRRLANASIYVLPSVDEPFPMSVLEAMSVGTPVVVTESCGLARDIWGAGAGAVIKPNIESLTSSLREMLSDPTRLRRMGDSAKALVEANFSIQSVGSRLLGHYELIGRVRQ